MKLLLWILISGCTTSPSSSTTWSDEQIVSGVFPRLDEDGDGKLSTSELPSEGLNFSSVDTNKDRGVSPTELLIAIQAQDPLEFDARPARPAVSVSRWRKAQHQSPEIRLRWEFLQFLIIESRQRSPQTVLPDSATTSTLATQGGPNYDEAIKRLRQSLESPQH